jgi:uncharacterized protein
VAEAQRHTSPPFRGLHGSISRHRKGPPIAVHRSEAQQNPAQTERGMDVPVKPSENEEEYFARQELERRRWMAKESEAAKLEQEKERHRLLHFMRCPKCGTELQEVAFGDVRVDKCFGCEGLWLDNGELEKLQTKEAGFATRLLKVFKG